MTEPDARRPIASRNAAWSKRTAAWLARTGVTPNQISVASMVCAALAAVLLCGAAHTLGGLRAGLLIGAIVACQGRLLCNLFDGMVAIEGGLAAMDGPFWNEFPDRVSDTLILVAAGYAAGSLALGWAAAALAIATAYVRELGRAVGAPADYRGPMAKQHRMALLCAALAVSAIEPFWNWQGQSLQIALLVIALGSGLTVLRRAMAQVSALKSG
jgi:phosphatidylglycerophosphate synthase